MANRVLEQVCHRHLAVISFVAREEIVLCPQRSLIGLWQRNRASADPGAAGLRSESHIVNVQASSDKRGLAETTRFR